MFQASTFFSLTERLGVEKYFNLLLLHLLVLTIYPNRPIGNLMLKHVTIKYDHEEEGYITRCSQISWKELKELKNSIASNDTQHFLKRGANHKFYSTHF